MEIQEPVRVRRRWVQHHPFPPGSVFPLLCPVREAEWVEGWDPKLVISESGVAEPGCVFVTPADSGDAIWVTTLHDPEALRVEFVKVTPGETVGEIRIALEEDGAGGTRSAIEYAYTALGPGGEAFVRAFDEAAWAAFMRKWETALGRHLASTR